MRNQIDYGADALDQLDRFLAAAPDSDAAERAADQLELCLRWYDPRLDPDRTMNCGAVTGPGLLPVPHYTARMIEVPPLRFYFMIEDASRPFIIRVVRVDWVLTVIDPDSP